MKHATSNISRLFDKYLEPSSKHWWFSGRIAACHAVDPGSIPGQCTSLALIAQLVERSTSNAEVSSSNLDGGKSIFLHVPDKPFERVDSFFAILLNRFVECIFTALIDCKYTCCNNKEISYGRRVCIKCVGIVV